MNDEMFFKALDAKDQEIRAMRDLLRRIKELVAAGGRCCYCGTDNPHAKACEEALGIIKEIPS